MSDKKYSFKLLSGEGRTMLEKENVYVSHWDKGIYDIYDEKDGEILMRFHKGDNMLLIVEPYSDK